MRDFLTQLIVIPDTWLQSGPLRVRDSKCSQLKAPWPPNMAPHYVPHYVPLLSEGSTLLLIPDTCLPVAPVLVLISPVALCSPGMFPPCPGLAWVIAWNFKAQPEVLGATETLVSSVCSELSLQANGLLLGLNRRK